jgi:hypothetical protein
MTKPAANTPEGMVKIPAGEYVFKVQGVEIEGSNEAAWMCNIYGKGLRGDFMRIECT